jgi:hypothetical protein
MRIGLLAATCVLCLCGCLVPGTSTGVYIGRAYDDILVSTYLLPPDPNFNDHAWTVSQPIHLQRVDDEVQLVLEAPDSRYFHGDALLLDDAFADDERQAEILSAARALDAAVWEELYMMLQTQEAVCSPRYEEGPYRYAEGLHDSRDGVLEWAGRHRSQLAGFANLAGECVALPVWTESTIWLLCLRGGALEAASTLALAGIFLTNDVPSQTEIASDQWFAPGEHLLSLYNTSAWHRLVYFLAPDDVVRPDLARKSRRALEVWHVHPVPTPQQR